MVYSADFRGKFLLFKFRLSAFFEGILWSLFYSSVRQSVRICFCVVLVTLLEVNLRFIVGLLRLVDFPPLFVALTKLWQLLTMHSNYLLPKNLATFLIHLLLSRLSDFGPCLARTILVFQSHNAIFTIL